MCDKLVWMKWCFTCVVCDNVQELTSPSWCSELRSFLLWLEAICFYHTQYMRRYMIELVSWRRLDLCSLLQGYNFLWYYMNKRIFYILTLLILITMLSDSQISFSIWSAFIKIWKFRKQNFPVMITHPSHTITQLLLSCFPLTGIFGSLCCKLFMYKAASSENHLFE